MNEQILIELLSDIQHENVRFGYCEVRFTFHDGRPVNYELTIHRRKKLVPNKQSENLNTVKTYDEKRRY